MIPAFELRRRARACLGMNVFGSLWLLSVLATIIASAMLSAASYVVVGVLILMGPVSVGLATVRLRLARGEGKGRMWCTVHAKALPVQQFFKALRYRSLKPAEQETGTVPRNELVFEHTL